MSVRSRFASAVAVGSLACILAVAARSGGADLRVEEIVTILPRDAIPAILKPSFKEASEASWLEGEQLVVGVEIGGEGRAYPVPTLSHHEIVNDRVGGLPIAVTW